MQKKVGFCTFRTMQPNLRERDPNDLVLFILLTLQGGEALTPVEINGTQYNLRGKFVQALDVGTPAIEFLAEDSTPRNPRHREGFVDDFISFVEKSAEDKKPFATTPRLTWVTPATLWSLE